MKIDKEKLIYVFTVLTIIAVGVHIAFDIVLSAPQMRGLLSFLLGAATMFVLMKSLIQPYGRR